MKTKYWLAITLIGTILVPALPAMAQSDTNTESEIELLKQQIQELQQKVDALQQQQQQQREAQAQEAPNTVPVKPTATLSVGADGVNFRSADSNFLASLHAWVQVDSRTFFQDEHAPGIDGFLLRRARLIYLGTVFHNFDYNFTPEFGGTSPQILDAYVNYHYVPEIQLQFGKFKPPVGLEALQPDIYTFLNERSLATDLVPYRGIGAEFHGTAAGAVDYAAGVFNGLPDYTTTTINVNEDNNVAFAGRIFVSPFKQTTISPLKGFGVGVSGSYERDNTDAGASGLTPGFTTDGQQKFFTYASSTVPDGRHWRVSPQGYYYWGPLGFMGEYVISDQTVEKTTAPVAKDDLHNKAWEVSGGWVLTGEPDSYNGVIPRHPFSIENRGWGAWQIVGRYARLNVDDLAFSTFGATGAAQAEAWAVGLNWYLNADLRANLSYAHTAFSGGAATVVTSHPEDVLFTRVQLAF
ncbi:MAG TPA: porin [Candidatus Sulfotelmatobacter sp.]|nr:porin [Candidatus Sulfotelmatobacter sp.]